MCFFEMIAENRHYLLFPGRTYSNFELLAALEELRATYIELYLGFLYFAHSCWYVYTYFLFSRADHGMDWQLFLCKYNLKDTKI